MPETKKYKKGIAITATLAILIGAGFSAYMWNARKTISPHYVDSACAVCHTYFSVTCVEADCFSCHPPDVAEIWSQLKASELDLCTSCHEQEGDVEVQNAEGVLVSVDLGNSHPFGLVPSEKSMPAALPLNDGKVTCQTCHDVHLSNLESHMLRLGTGTDYTPLCLDCHQGY
jgi:predicted CXXCH cytochrome family protein